jgi:hypothetical protein
MGTRARMACDASKEFGVSRITFCISSALEHLSTNASLPERQAIQALSNYPLNAVRKPFRAPS